MNNGKYRPNGLGPGGLEALSLDLLSECKTCLVNTRLSKQLRQQLERYIVSCSRKRISLKKVNIIIKCDKRNIIRKILSVCMALGSLIAFVCISRKQVLRAR